MRKLKSFNELLEGNCIIIIKNIHGEKCFNGYFREKFNCLFFAIPSTYEIIGYIQD